MAKAQDAQNIGKIEKSIESLISKSQDDLEKEAAVLLQRQMGSARRKIASDIENDLNNNIYQDKKKNIKDHGIRWIEPKSQNEADKIYRPKEENQQTPEDMFDEFEDEKQQGKTQQENKQEKDGDTITEEAKEGGEGEESGKKDKDRGKKEGEKGEEKKDNEKDKTPDWQKEEPKTAEGGMARADTGDISPQKKTEEKPFSDKATTGKEKQRNRDLSREQRLAKIKKNREDKVKKKKEKEKEEAERKEDASIGKMSPLTGILWLFGAIAADIGSLIPYVGLLISWPFAIAFGIFKWIIKIKKSLAIATTALDFLFEGLLSTLPVNIVDVILTFVLSNSKTVRKATKKISETIPGKK